MPRYTLIEMTQDIISDVSGDYINSISDTEESEQIAQIIQSTYWELIESKHTRWEHLRSMVQLSPSNDTSKPTHMKINDNVYELRFLRYDKQRSGDTRTKYEDVTYLTPETFLEKLNSRNSSETNYTQVNDYSSIPLIIRTDIPPTYYTSFDDQYFVFDSYDSSVESTLQSSKTQAYVTKIPVWTHEDSFIPDLPPQAFSLLLAEAKSTCWNALKQLPNKKEEQRATRQRRNLNLNSQQINTGAKRRVSGRRSRK